MAELLPSPLARLVTRAFEELDRQRSIFDLPARKFVLGDPRFDTSVDVHHHRVGTPLGPSAGPHTQMAQNIVLCWLAGARVMELKTIQILDSLSIARPCIDARTVGFNVEWSQELKIEQSLEEYVKASMLIEMLSASGVLEIQPAFERALFDVSVGYDLQGIRSERVTAFLRGMLDAGKSIEAFRRQIPERWRRLREVDFTSRIADTVTLSTFHGCPAHEIESIADYLMTEIGVDCTIKLNPTLLGRRAVHEVLHDRLGFTDIEVPPTAFENDTTWQHAVEIVGRLRQRARDLGRSFGVKLTNTLLVENRSDFLPRSEKVAYLSGAPLHVMAMHLVHRFRRAFGDSIPISFSAGIDRLNYADAVSLGLSPVTVCTDLLKQGGYGRLPAYAKALHSRMEAIGAYSISDFIRRGRPVTVAEAKILNTEEYVKSLDGDPRYHSEQLARPARKRGRPLELFDCATCDLCIPACPNDAIFKIPSLDAGATKPHQIACFAELCNDCGNCEAFCPDHGAPNRLKFRLFASEEAWRRDAPRDAFWINSETVVCRIAGNEYSLDQRGDRNPDTWPYALMDYVRRAVLDPSGVNYINCLPLEESNRP
ncbi:MAG: glutamate synthase [Thermoanaerobaculia bacterium]